MKIKNSRLTKLASGVTAAAFALGVAVPALLAGSVSAASINTASIQMSTAAPGAAAQYKLTFTPSTTEASGEVVVDFCSDSAIVGDTCAFSAATVPTIASPASDVGSASVVGTGTPKHTVLVTGLTLTSGTPITITFTSGFTNPTSVGTFYGRILTYPTGDGSEYTPAATTGGATTIGADNQDNGGVALSTATNVSIDARVMPTITFCVSGPTSASDSSNPMGTGCTGATTPDISIGHGSTNGPKVITSDTVDTAPFYSQLSTNAQSGATISAHMTDTGSGCHGLVNTLDNTKCIDAVGASPATISAGDGTFGLNVADGTGTTGSTTAAAPYSTASEYALDTGASGITSTFGQALATSSGATANVDNTYTLAATASATTPSGLYTADMSLIATGKF